MTQKKETRTVQNPCFLEAAKLPVLMYRQQVGTFRAYDDPNRVVKIGMPGQADSGLIVPVTITANMVGRTIGVAVQVEFKQGTGKQKENQSRWQAAVEKAGGIYAVVRSVGEFKEFLGSILSGEFWANPSK